MSAVSVLILTQPHEYGVTLKTLDSLARELHRDVEAIVLVNGAPTPPALRGLDKRPHVSLVESSENLGVAGGRNRLLDEALGRGSEYFVILDNDVRVPDGMIAALVHAYRTSDRIGVLGPAILNHRPAVRAVPETDNFGEPLSMHRLHGALMRIAPTEWFHLGGHPDWFQTYVLDRAVRRRLAQRHDADSDLSDWPANLQDDAELVRRIVEGDLAAIDVSNVAGCCQVFDRSLLDEIGMLDDLFSPYGYEDVDFCIRSRRSGRRNIVDPSILLTHGTDLRHKSRRARSARYDVQRNMARCRTLITARHGGDEWSRIVIENLLARYALNAETDHGAPDFWAHVDGIRTASRQLVADGRGVVDELLVELHTVETEMMR